MKNGWLLSLAIYSLINYTTCTFEDPPSQNEGDVYGRVIDTHTGEAVPHARVFLGVKDYKTFDADNQGRYSFENVEAGTYILSAASDDYLTHFSNISVLENQPTKVNVQMEKRDQLSINKD